MIGRTLIAFAVLISACGGETASTTTSEGGTTTSDVPIASSTTTVATTTTTKPTTTTVPTADLTVEVALYDGFVSDTLQTGASCESGPDFSFLVPNTQAVLQDANTGETLAVASLSKGRLKHELGPNADLPASTFDLFYYCAFPGQMENVPLDRSFYRFFVEGDRVIGDEGLTYDGSQITNTKFVGSTYFYSDAENTRAANR